MGVEMPLELGFLLLPSKVTFLSLLKTAVANTLPPAAVFSALHSSRCVHFLFSPKHYSYKPFVCVSDLLKIWQNRHTHTYTMGTSEI